MTASDSNSITPNLRAKIAFRIARHLDANPTSTPAEATSAAAWEALEEVRAAGWDQDRQASLVYAFLTVGAEIAAEALRNL